MPVARALGHVGLRFLLELIRQLGHQVGQLLAERQCGRVPAAVGVFEFFQVAMDGGFRAGIAQLDPYCVDAGILTPRQDGLAGFLNQRLVDAAAGHGLLLRFHNGLHTMYLHTKLS